jgi:glycosyltransferase involved in cell wall biosynthesis
MLRVAHLGKFYPPVRGGMERAVHALCCATRDRLAHEVIAFNTNRASTDEQVDGINVTRVGTWLRAGSVPVAPGLIGRLRSLRADVAVLHEPNPWALVAWAAAAPDVPVAIWFHSEVVRPRAQYELFYAPLAARVYPRARRFIVSSPTLAREATALARYQDRIAVIPFGVDATPFSTSEAATRARDLRATVTGPLLLFAGRLVPYKGLDVLIDAVSPLPVTVAVVGDGPMRDQWSRRAQSVTGGARFLFVGEVPEAELPAWMRACVALVLPSVTRAEAFGLVQLEAMAAGKPVISTNLPTGVPWVNQHGVTGLVVPPGDPLALRAAIESLIGQPGLAERLGHAGASRASRDFTTAQMANAFVRVCADVAGARHA